MKLKTLSLTLLSTACLMSSNFAHADQIEKSRAQKVAELTIQLFSQPSNDSGIKFAAAISGTSEAQIKKNAEQSGQPIMSAPERIKQLMEEQFGTEDMKIIGPVFEQQQQVQNEIMSTCKLTGKVIQANEASYEFPMVCQVPKIDWDTIQKPENLNETEKAKSLATVIAWGTKTIKAAPRQKFNSSILIHKQGQNLVPELDDENYFPSSVAKQLSDSSDSEVDAAE